MGKPTTDELIELFDRTFSEDSLERLCLGIWHHDRWCTWDEWKKGTQLCADALRDGGVADVEMIPWRTDEEHATGRCRMTEAGIPSSRVYFSVHPWMVNQTVSQIRTLLAMTMTATMMTTAWCSIPSPCRDSTVI